MAADVLTVLIDWDDVAGVAVRMSEVLAPRNHHEVAEDIDGASVFLIRIQVSKWSRVLLTRFIVAHLCVRVDECQIVLAVGNRIVVLMLPVGAQVRWEWHMREATDHKVLVGGGTSRVVHALLSLDENEDIRFAFTSLSHFLEAVWQPIVASLRMRVAFLALLLRVQQFPLTLHHLGDFGHSLLSELNHSFFQVLLHLVREQVSFDEELLLALPLSNIA